jgi:hypothetical protein
MTNKQIKKRGRPKKADLIQATLDTAGKQYKSEGKTIEEALANFPINYTHIKTKGIITVSKGKIKAEKLFYLKPLRMLFANHLRRAGFAHQLENLLVAADK